MILISFIKPLESNRYPKRFQLINFNKLHIYYKTHQFEHPGPEKIYVVEYQIQLIKLNSSHSATWSNAANK